MRILFVQDSLGTGGAERSNSKLWYFLREQKGIKIKIVVLEHRKEGVEEEVLSNGFDVTFLKKGNYISQVNQTKAIIENYKPNIVHSVLFRSAMRVRAAKVLTGCFHVESLVSCSYSEVRLKDPKINRNGLLFYKFLNGLTHRKGTDRFIALTEEVKKHFVDHLKIAPEKIKVIPRGREENPMIHTKDEARTKLEVELDTKFQGPVFIHVGRQEYQKGHLNLLKALKIIDRELSELKAQIIFCGRKGNSTEELQEFLGKNPFSTKIHWLGHRNDVPAILAGADVFVFPSVLEGLGGALIEAQAAKLPVVCSNIPVFNEVVLEDQNALFFEVGDPKKLSEKLLLMARSPELRKSFGVKSLENFQNNFQIEKIHQKMLNYYKTVVK